MATQDVSSDNTASDLGIAPASRSTVVKHDYLWISPEGRAFPGAHHQLMLQIIALDFSWSESSPLDFGNIRRRLREKLPTCIVSHHELENVIQEFLNLDHVTKGSLKDAQARKQQLRCQELVNGVLDNLLTDPDPRLYEEAEAELLQDYTHRQSSENPQDGAAFLHAKASPFTPEEVSCKSTNPVWDNASVSTCKLEKLRGGTHYIESGNLSSSNNHTSLRNSSSGGHKHSLAQSSPHATEMKTNMNKAWSAPAPETILSIDDDIRITPENARVYAPLYLASLTKMRFGETSISFTLGAEKKTKTSCLVGEQNTTQQQQTSLQILFGKSSEHPGELRNVFAGYPVMPSGRRPDRSRVVKGHGNRITVPASEAEPFIAWFTELTDAVPETIEGYAWYCERCYNQSVVSNKLGKAKGKFSCKAGVEKHYQQAHNERWKPVLPERERTSDLQSTSLDANHADEGSKVLDDRETSDTPQRVHAQQDRRTFEGLQAIGTPSSMKIGEDYKYQPTKVRRKLFRDELGLREGDVNRSKPKKQDSLRFEDIQEENKSPKIIVKMRRHGGKQSAWKVYETLPTSPRKVVFSEKDSIREFEKEESCYEGEEDQRS